SFNSIFDSDNGNNGMIAIVTDSMDTSLNMADGFIEMNPTNINNNNNNDVSLYLVTRNNEHNYSHPYLPYHQFHQEEPLFLKDLTQSELLHQENFNII